MIPRLHLILDLETLEAIGRDPVALAVAAVTGGVGAVHLRAPGRPADALFELTQALREALAGRALLLVNDRFDVALAAGAGGVQLPGAGLPPGVVRALVEGREPVRRGGGRPWVIGCSVHDPEHARAVAIHADFLLLGTVFGSRSHPGRAPGGEALVRAVRAVTRVPLIAIGGITTDTAAQAIAAGADGVAVIRAIAEARDPAEAAAGLLRAIGRTYPDTRRPYLAAPAGHGASDLDHCRAVRRNGDDPHPAQR